MVYNTNGYELVDALRTLEGLVDIYLPDLKYVSQAAARRYSGAADYFDFARPAVLEMQRQCGVLQLDGEGVATRGLLIRHLVLPGSVDEARGVLDFVAAELPLDTQLSLMSQYVPCHLATMPPINRAPDPAGIPASGGLLPKPGAYPGLCPGAGFCGHSLYAAFSRGDPIGSEGDEALGEWLNGWNIEGEDPDEGSREGRHVEEGI